MEKKKFYGLKEASQVTKISVGTLRGMAAKKEIETLDYKEGDGRIVRLLSETEIKKIILRKISPEGLKIIRSYLLGKEDTK